MGKIIEARLLLSDVGMPTAQQSELCCLSLLALAGLTEEMAWSDATNEWLRIHDLIVFVNTNYGISYAENSRETFRKQAMHPFRTAALIEDNGMATNSPNYRYRLTEEALSLLKNNQANEWDYQLKIFKSYHQSVIDIYASKKRMELMSVNINNNNYTFSPGRHNELQKAIVEEFAPRFAPGVECLYIGDTAKKDLVNNTTKLQELGFGINLHDKLPDVVLYREDKDWLFFIEAVTSVGPMNSKRILEINEMTKGVKSGKIYVTAFLDMATYKSFMSQLAWETEVWIAESPDHMIHLDGNRFLEPKH